MFDRDITDYIKYSAKYYPVVTVTGPRQSGKTTLVKMIFSDKPYVSLEDIDIREFAQNNGMDLPYIQNEKQMLIF